MDEKDRQTTESRTTETTDQRPVTQEASAQDTKAPGNVVAKRVVYYIGGTIIALLALRFILQLLAANPGSPFVDFVYGLAGFFVMPFYGIFGEPTYGQAQFETSTLFAIVIYALLTVGIAKLFTISSRQQG